MVRLVKMGDIVFGAGEVYIQSMTNTPTTDVEATVEQIRALLTAGADFVRISIPDQASVAALARIKQEVSCPLVADIHFDYRLALDSFDVGADKVRINPGNIGDWDKVLSVMEKAKKLDKVVRVGVNGGSLEKDLLKKYGRPSAEALVESALGFDHRLSELGYENYLVSIKSSSVVETIVANRAFRKQSNTPLQIGVTEAGTVEMGTIKSAVGIGSLLADGIGETLRVSLTADPVKEIAVAKQILQAVGLRKEGIEIISCPTCARTHGNLISLVEKVESLLRGRADNLKVAIMGCVVNGPGEAREADLGLAMGDGKWVIFRRGEIICTINEEDYLDVLMRAIDNFDCEF